MGLGTAAARLPGDESPSRALAAFDTGASRRSPVPRAMGFAALGAADRDAVTADQRLLIGAYFTQEFSVEAAACSIPRWCGIPTRTVSRRGRCGSC